MRIFITICIIVSLLIYAISTTLPDNELPDTGSVPLDSIVLISCGDAKGTSSVIGENIFIAASHVVTDKDGNEQECFIDGFPVTITYNDKRLDYAILVGDTKQLKRLPIDCEGFKEDQPYLMIGYADGSDFVIHEVYASNIVDTYYTFHTRVLFGKPAISGMSGGPVLDLNGNQVGTILASNLDNGRSLSREMKDTVFCD